MTLGFNTLFGQRDVRETATETASTVTKYWSTGGVGFLAQQPDTEDVNYNANGWGEATATGNAIAFTCAVYLPHNAVVTAITVFGNAGAAAETYTLERNDFAAGTPDEMAGANIGTEDASISNATINNNTHQYWINTSTLDANDIIYGVRITYTI